MRAGGGERGSRCSGSSQTPCKESCHAAGLDTLPRPSRGLVPPAGHPPAPRAPPAAGRDPRARNLPCLGLVATSPCPGTFLSPQLLAVSPASPSPVPVPVAEAGALIAAPAAGAEPGAACPNPCAPPARLLRMQLSTDTSEAFEGEKYPFPTQNTRSQEEKGARGVLTSARTNPSASTQRL